MTASCVARTGITRDDVGAAVESAVPGVGDAVADGASSTARDHGHRRSWRSRWSGHWPTCPPATRALPEVPPLRSHCSVIARRHALEAASGTANVTPRPRIMPRQPMMHDCRSSTPERRVLHPTAPVTRKRVPTRQIKGGDPLTGSPPVPAQDRVVLGSGTRSPEVAGNTGHRAAGNTRAPRVAIRVHPNGTAHPAGDTHAVAPIILAEGQASSRRASDARPPRSAPEAGRRRARTRPTGRIP